MSNTDSTNVAFLVLIAGRKEKNMILTALSQYGVQLLNTLYGKGSVRAGYFSKMFGFIPEENKVVITCLLNTSKLNPVLDMLVEKFNFNTPNTGIAFTIDVDVLSF